MPRTGAHAVSRPRPGQPLGPRETDVLRHCAEGLSYKEIGRLWGTSENTAKATAQHALVKLGAVSIAQAVHIAGMDGLIGWYRDCGDRRAYRRHIRNGESPCLLCRRANTAVHNEYIRTRATRRGSEQHQ